MKQKDRILWIKNHCERLVELLSTDQNGLKDQVTFNYQVIAIEMVISNLIKRVNIKAVTIFGIDYIHRRA